MVEYDKENRSIDDSSFAVFNDPPREFEQVGTDSRRRSIRNCHGWWASAISGDLLTVGVYLRGCRHNRLSARGALAVGFGRLLTEDSSGRARSSRLHGTSRTIPRELRRPLQDAVSTALPGRGGVPRWPERGVVQPVPPIQPGKTAVRRPWGPSKRTTSCRVGVRGHEQA
jgi:hypothetical protein